MMCVASMGEYETAGLVSGKHSPYGARVEHLFARLWQWRVVHNVWTPSATELHGHIRILLHLTQFCIQGQTRYQPGGPWPHMPKAVWAQEEAFREEEENDDGVFFTNCVHTVKVNI